jgi:hypothetical protein
MRNSLLILSGTLLTVLILSSFQAAAHPAASEDGIGTALDTAGVNPNGDGLFEAWDASGGMNGGGIGQQVPHNPLCGGHSN